MVLRILKTILNRDYLNLKVLKKENFLFHLKEYKFRCNTKTTQKIYIKLLKLTRENPLKLC